MKSIISMLVLLVVLSNFNPSYCSPIFPNNKSSILIQKKKDLKNDLRHSIIKHDKKHTKNNNQPVKSLDEDNPEKEYKQLVALLLAIFIGVLGIHRFYLGYTGIGILMLLTAGCCGVLALIDIIRIATGSLKPKDGEYTEKV